MEFDGANQEAFGAKTGIYNTLIYPLENYGWYLLLFGVLFAYFYKKMVKSHIDDYMKRRAENEYIAKYHKNPDLFINRQLAQEQRARELQDKYKKDAEAYKKKLEEKEAKKREEILEKLDETGGGGGRKLGSTDDNKKSFKPEYHPLSGGGSSSTYRPPRRSACSRGGCG